MSKGPGAGKGRAYSKESRPVAGGEEHGKEVGGETRGEVGPE